MLRLICICHVIGIVMKYYQPRKYFLFSKTFFSLDSSHLQIIFRNIWMLLWRLSILFSAHYRKLFCWIFNQYRKQYISNTTSFCHSLQARFCLYAGHEGRYKNIFLVLALEEACMISRLGLNVSWVQMSGYHLCVSDHCLL